MAFWPMYATVLFPTPRARQSGSARMDQILLSRQMRFTGHGVTGDIHT